MYLTALNNYVYLNTVAASAAESEQWTSDENDVEAVAHLIPNVTPSLALCCDDLEMNSGFLHYYILFCLLKHYI